MFQVSHNAAAGGVFISYGKSNLVALLALSLSLLWDLVCILAGAQCCCYLPNFEVSREEADNKH